MRTQEATDKMTATKAASRERYAAQTVDVDEHWRIIRVDEWNWQIQRKNKGEWKPWPQVNYYGTIISALKAIPATMLHLEASGTVAALLRLNSGISDKIEAAASRAEFAMS